MEDKEAVDFYKNLTTPDSEDWLIIPRGNKLFLTAMRENKRLDGKKDVYIKNGFCATNGIKECVTSMDKDNELGCVTIILCRDANKFGGVELLEWFTEKAKEKDFSVVSMIGSATTAMAIRSAKEQADLTCVGTA